MLRDKAVDTILRRLKTRTGTTALKDNIVKEMAIAQEVILEGNAELPWFLVAQTSVALAAGSNTSSFPATLLEVWEDGGLYLTISGEDKRLNVEDWDVIRSQVNVETEGTPTQASYMGENFLWGPTPDDAYTVSFYGYLKEASLDGVYGDAANVENGWLKHAADWLMAETGAVVAAQLLGDVKAAGDFVAQAGRAKKRVMDKNVYMQELLKQRFMEG